MLPAVLERTLFTDLIRHRLECVVVIAGFGVDTAIESRDYDSLNGQRT